MNILTTEIKAVQDFISRNNIKQATLNSKNANLEVAFVATTGITSDGREYLKHALLNGCKNFIIEAKDLTNPKWHNIILELESNPELNLCFFSDITLHLPSITKSIYQNSSTLINSNLVNSVMNLPIIGVTGTNGKTTVTNLIAQWLKLTNTVDSLAVMGTIGLGIYPNLEKSTNTTLNLLDNYYFLSKFAEQGAKLALMEVSSHALHYNKNPNEQVLASETYPRVLGLPFQQAIFTNLSQDHLDFHKDMEEYFQVKSELFLNYGIQKFIINVDNFYGQQLYKLLQEKFGHLTDYTILAVQSKAYLQQDNINPILNVLEMKNYIQLQEAEYNQAGQKLKIKVKLTNLEASIEQKSEKVINQAIDKVIEKEIELSSVLLGAFNTDNLLYAFASCLLAGANPAVLADTVQALQSIKGRMQILKHNDITVVIDYAHTPDALEKAIQATQEHFNDEVWCVFGCGGNRDKGKRPLMGAVANKYVKHIIVTNDNPRNEDPKVIAQEISSAIAVEKCIVILDRKEAIAYALANAKPGAAILIAGKGHETEQIIAGQVYHFSDEEVVREFWSNN